MYYIISMYHTNSIDVFSFFLLLLTPVQYLLLKDLVLIKTEFLQSARSHIVVYKEVKFKRTFVLVL